MAPLLPFAAMDRKRSWRFVRLTTLTFFLSLVIFSYAFLTSGWRFQRPTTHSSQLEPEALLAEEVLPEPEAALHQLPPPPTSEELSWSAPLRDAYDVDNVVYPVTEFKQSDYNSANPLVMTILHDTRKIWMFVQGIGKQSIWDLETCWIGDTKLEVGKNNDHKRWVVAECAFPDRNVWDEGGAIDLKEFDGKGLKVSFVERISRRRRWLGTRFNYDVQRTMPPATTPVSEMPYKVCLVTELYNQTHVLKDWWNYYSNMGVDRFFLYDNDSGDDINGMFERDPSLSEKATLIRWPWNKAQPHAFMHGKLLADRLCQWTFFPDVDEFLYLKDCHPSYSEPSSTSSTPTTPHGQVPSFRHCIPDFITQQTQYDFENPHPENLKIAQIRLMPRTFGSSEMIHRPKQPYTLPEAFIHRSPFPNAYQRLQTKPLLHTRAAQLVTLVHFWNLLDESYETVKPQPEVDRAEVIHYKIQSWEDFMVKYNRPRVGYVNDWKVPEGMTRPLSRDVPPPGWREGTFFKGGSKGYDEVVNATVRDTEFRDWKRWMEGILSGREMGEVTWEE
ncbi:hypothetical protein HK097_001314 [Rhizophlyctis rosea]|uniref:Glycosyltransferase family 92 protein n=1 Tax=Rhizophlyctis rosea TaxID=64517 RepID=A0AAD5X1F1_9FUNG|nr:hypothetical protein HK097_001314 [Rhizophlyctis rosea]